CARYAGPRPSIGPGWRFDVW
nr:immunoglobulin heavy chain junction region [Macaca mulatta]MOW92685.1 immunoglobulin heavy chain junction region [Macaca mulatta]